jgi:ribonuclease HII
LIIAGIDEAGYGPLLGPLIATGVAFEVPDALADTDLWDATTTSIARAPTRGDTRLPIADSKKLYQRSAGLATLERTALVMLAAAGRAPQSLRGLLKVVAPQVVEALDTYPWYQGYDPGLPQGTSAADVTTRANAIRRDAGDHGVRLCGVYSEVLLEGQFNQLVARTHNKATALFRLVLLLVQRLMTRHGGTLRVLVDRQGGREHYVEKLLTFFQGARLRVIEESPQRSAYALTLHQRTWEITFTVAGEDRHLPIALASVYSKYLREMLMGGINAYFGARVADLKPTAGYYTDAQRFLADVEPVIRADRLDREMLVRCR